MKKLIRLMITTAMIAVFAAGCGKESSKITTTEGVKTDQEASEDGETEGALEKGTTKEDTGPAGTEDQATQEDSGVPAKRYPYTYVDVSGREVILEKEPVKIATDYLPLWETLLLLDITPVAASGAENYLATWDPFQDLNMGEIIDLGSSEVNLELLLELQPDVFLHQVADPSNIDVANFEKISPVAVFGPETKMDWRLSLREVGKLVGREEKAEEVIAEFDKKIADSREKLQGKYEGQTVFQMSLMDVDKYYCSYRPVLYDKKAGLGLTAPEGHTTSENYEQVSMEAIVAMNPDYIFVNVFDGDEAIYEELTNNSVWKSLKAVQADHVVKLDGAGHANSGLAMQYTINKIVNALLIE
ncbi:ABC transporter substrate-binding protein [Anaerocolumna sp. AGMB13025]|uniref:ABC transporter substrate-binding protein n=1 Tax=Anaerocolumna sp. AGMB13025 TaxID=3039116 RepID=UPI00241E1D8C|nr:ABC transporter substrate-binding protein [Anaerocolumna sp. AGMB13025]WFR57799.1 ABC transporter substrate-binding protein [Anaerocolumna sp. AGMB13025]